MLKWIYELSGNGYTIVLLSFLKYLFVTSYPIHLAKFKVISSCCKKCKSYNVLLFQEMKGGRFVYKIKKFSFILLASIHWPYFKPALEKNLTIFSYVK